MVGPPARAVPWLLNPIALMAAWVAIKAGLNLPLGLLGARLFRGPLREALAIGALLGAAEASFVAGLHGRLGPSALAGLIVAVLGALGGAAFAWRVWRRCIAPLRPAA